MSRLQEAVDRFAAQWTEANGGRKPSQDEVVDGLFCAWTGEPFCLCLKLGTGLGLMISMKGLTCMNSGKPVTDDSYAWTDEARTERARLRGGDSS